MFSLAAISRMHDANTPKNVRVPSVDRLMSTFPALDYNGANMIRVQIRDSTDPVATLRAINNVLDGSGVEYIRADGDDECVRGIEYVNVGDTYAQTIAYDQYTRTFRITDGDIMVRTVASR